MWILKREKRMLIVDLVFGLLYIVETGLQTRVKNDIEIRYR